MPLLCTLLIAAATVAQPLDLPSNFDPEVNMIFSERETGRLHSSRGTARFAESLVANGAPRDLARAEEALVALFSCQELHEDDPHYGNFRWYLEDEGVEDLNAVEFVLSHLIPMMIRHGERFSEPIQEEVLERIRLGLGEISRLDVSVGYTNIATLDIQNSCLGGELLNVPRIAHRGYEKLKDLEILTTTNGTILEFNSPTYLSVTMQGLGELIQLTEDRETRIRAKTLATRLALGAALRTHPGTGRLAGPHSRAYQPTIACEDGPEICRFASWIEKGIAPKWIDSVVNRPRESYQIIETAFAEWNLGLSTYLSPSFAMGVATRQLMEQSNVFMIHYNRPQGERPGVVYSRYVVGDKWLGDFYHATDRSMSRNFDELGEFWGVQNGPRAIGLYKPPSLHYQESGKAVLIWSRRDLIDEIWIGDHQVENLPLEVRPGETVVIGSGDAYVAVRPLTLTDLGRDAPIRLDEKAGDLVLEMYNYRGPKKAFWELEWPGGFFKGRPQCGFYAEVAERSAYTSGKNFAAEISRGELQEETESPFTYDGTNPRVWSAQYTRDGLSLGIEVDLMEWKLLKRWNQEGELDWPMMESPFARQNSNGAVEVGAAVLTCGKRPAWLYADSENEFWVAGYHGDPEPLALQTPQGKVEIESMGTGTVIWDRGRVEVESVLADVVSRVKNLGQ